MPLFKYTVTNSEGKKLSGTVEAPDENVARSELNNLGFSIFALELTEKAPLADPSLKKYNFEAIDKEGRLVSGSIPAKDEKEAFTKLQKEYGLTVSAVTQENATPDQIATSRKKYGDANQQIVEETKQENLAKEKEDAFQRAKIENVLKEVNTLLQKFDANFGPEQKAEINKRISKLLRVKRSTNLEYVLATADSLLEYIESQEKGLMEKGLSDQRIELKLQTKGMLDRLHANQKKKSLQEDVLGKIQAWQAKYAQKDPTQSASSTKFVSKLLLKLQGWFETPPDEQKIKNIIKAYKKQRWQFIQLYFKEPNKEYKQKVKTNIKAVTREIKKAKAQLKALKKSKTAQPSTAAPVIRENVMLNFTKEVNLFSGWLLAFYVIYYFISLYLSTKNFGFSEIPAGFRIYESQIFKYLLATIFILHTTTSLKINFFQKSKAANFVLLPAFLIGTIIAILNF